MARRLEQHEKYEYEHLLGLTGTYDKKSLKKAYLKCVREWHPDLATKNGHTDEEASEMTKKINNAFVELSGLLSNATATVTCETSPTATGARTATPDAGSTGSASHTDRRSAYGTPSAHGTTTRTATATGTHAGHATTATNSADVYDTVPTDAYEPQPRGAVPRNMAAAMRYTRIVTSSAFVKWFVAGIGPHIVFAFASLILLALLGVCISGLYGLAGIILMVRLLPFAIIYDVITGKGAEMVGSAADIWAVNKAVNSTK